MTKVEKNYWYYSNDTYELRETKDPDGRVTSFNRNITGPIPPNELYPIVRGIDPDAPTWQDEIIERLAGEHFNTDNILKGVPTDWGLTLKGRLKYLTTKDGIVAVLIPAAKIAVISAIIIGYPGIIARCFPECATFLGMPTLTSACGIFGYGINFWTHMFQYSGGVIAFVAGGTILMSISGLMGFDILELRSTGPKTYEAWRADKIEIILRFQENLIPEEYEKDPILAENICPISHRAIRVPCLTRWGIRYEDVFLQTWIVSQRDNRLQPTCPVTRRPINKQDLTIDTALSDKIELRLLLLKSARQAV